MKSISDQIKSWINEHPLHAQLMSDGIINMSGLARLIHDDVSKYSEKTVSINAILHALNRHIKESNALADAKNIIDAVTIHKDISRIVFEKSDLSLAHFSKALKVLNEISDLILYGKGTDYLWIAGRKGIVEELATHFHHVAMAHSLAAVAITLKSNIDITPSTLSYIMQKFAAENIRIYEISTVNDELVLLVNRSHAQKARACLS